MTPVGLHHSLPQQPLSACVCALRNGGSFGTIAGAAVVLGEGSIINIPTALIALSSLVALWRFKLREPLLIGVAAPAGVLLYKR